MDGMVEHAKVRSVVVLRVGSPRTEPLGGPIDDQIGDLLRWPYCGRGALHDRRLQATAADVLELPTVVQRAALSVGIGWGGADEEDDETDAETHK